ncbi:MAG: PDZ domain-containing protein [Planctomycetota bacterium]
MKMTGFSPKPFAIRAVVVALCLVGAEATNAGHSTHVSAPDPPAIAAAFEQLGLASIEVPNTAPATTPEAPSNAFGTQRFAIPVDLGTTVSVEDATAILHLPGMNLPILQSSPLAAAMPFGASGSLKHRPVTFLGYGIVVGSAGYLGFPPSLDLTGRVALVLRYEPMRLDGTSRWASDGWGPTSRVAGKVIVAARRGAEAVLLVEPPGVNRDKRDDLDEFSRQNFTEPIADIPVFSLAYPQAAMLVAAGNPSRGTLADLTALANDEGSVVDLERVAVTLDADVRREPVVGQTVVAKLAGRGALAESVVLVAVLHDPDDPSTAAGIQTAASKLAASYDDLRGSDGARSVVFVAFDDSERGKPATDAFRRDPFVPLRDVHAAVTLEVSDAAGDHDIVIAGTASGTGLAAIIGAPLDTAPASAGFRGGIRTTGNEVPIPTVAPLAAIFDQRGVPHVAIAASSDVEKTIVGSIGAAVADALARDPAQLVYQGQGIAQREALGVTGTVKVRTGIAPSADTGRADGVRVAQVFPGTPAAAAGLRRGDRIVSWNGVAVENPEAWSRLLPTHEPGDRVEVIFFRRRAQMRVIMTLEARDR